MPATSISSNITDPIPATHPPGMRPVHPGEILEEVLKEGLRVSVKEAAQRLRVSRQTLHRIISGRAAITAEMAHRLGKLCGNGPELWAAMQMQHDLAVSRDHLADELDLIPGPDQAA